jgi:WD40 repeat protein
LYSARRQEYVCEGCGHRWPFLDQAPALDWPAGLAPADLPTYLAAPLAALLAEPHPRVRLHWLMDCAEIALRWSVAVALAQVVQANGGSLPERVAARLREHIERPTLGRWLKILQALGAARPAADLPAPGFFDLYDQAFAPRFRRMDQGGTRENSLLELRNDLAHGAGLRTVVARSLLERHQPGVFDLLRAVARAGQGTQVIALTGGQAERLAGSRPSSIARPVGLPAGLPAGADGPWLVTATGALPLLPLAGFGPVRLVGGAGRLEERPGDHAAQLYTRAQRERLEYVPLGRDEAVSFSFDLEAFRALFRLETDPAARGPAGAGPRWDDFLREARVLGEDLVGRAAERAVLRDWLKGRDTRQEGVAGIGLVTGGPGVGKSLLMARLATDQGNARPQRQALYYHRFRAGDARNSTRAFLLGLLAALDDWPVLPTAGAADDSGDTDQDLLETARARLAAVAGLPPPHPQAPAPRLLVLADGLDEALPQDPRLPQRLRELALPGTVWLLASRPEPALERAFNGPGCDHLFPDGLPPMSAADIRAMLIEGLEGAGKTLIARDEDAAAGVHNPFVARVVACAAGLPLYVHLLLEDLRHGRLTVRDEDRLPRGLVAYYDTLMERVGISDLRRDLPLLVACLARAEEPLDPEALAPLLAEVPADAPRYRERVQQAARAGQALLRTAPTPDGTLGLTLYHQSFRDYVGGAPASADRPAVPPAPALAGTVRDAELKLCRLADGWAGLPPGNLGNHLFRWGVRYALRWQGAEGLEAARRRLTDFPFLQAFTAELPSGAIRGLVADYEALLARLSDGPERQEFRLWEAFFREREHILRRGDERWPAYKVLLQLAVEHADDSPVTRAAEAWLAAGHCDWVWLRNPQRVARAVPDPCLRVLGGHTGSVKGALELSDGRILSWASDGTLQLWEGQNGALLEILKGHIDEVNGALEFADGRILSWSSDKTLRLWDRSGVPLATLGGHTASVDGIRLLGDGRMLSWSKDKTLCLWDGQSGAPFATLLGHTDRVVGVRLLADGRILSWSDDKTLRLWDGERGASLVALKGHTGIFRGVIVLANGNVLSWSDDKTLRLWNGQSGASLAILTGHKYAIDGVLELSDGHILSWSENENTLSLWDGKSGAPLATLVGHTCHVRGVRILFDGRILSWADDGTLRLWDGKTGAPLAILAGHTDLVHSVVPLVDGRILSSSYDKTLRLWDGRSGAPLATLAGHTDQAWGALLESSDGRIVSLSPDGTLGLWDGQRSTLLGTLAGVSGLQYLSDGRILARSSGNNTLRLLDGQSGVLLATLTGWGEDQCSVLNTTLLP